jgi:hypothetical protein
VGSFFADPGTALALAAMLFSFAGTIVVWLVNNARGQARGEAADASLREESQRLDLRINAERDRAEKAEHALEARAEKRATELMHARDVLVGELKANVAADLARHDQEIKDLRDGLTSGFSAMGAKLDAVTGKLHDKLDEVTRLITKVAMHGRDSCGKDLS